MDTIVSLKNFRTNLTKYAENVSKQTLSFSVYKKNKPMFRVVPITETETWETVVDFTEIYPQGISAKKILQALKKMSR